MIEGSNVVGWLMVARRVSEHPHHLARASALVRDSQAIVMLVPVGLLVCACVRDRVWLRVRQVKQEGTLEK
jgi:hypothetical protein